MDFKVKLINDFVIGYSSCTEKCDITVNNSGHLSGCQKIVLLQKM